MKTLTTLVLLAIASPAIAGNPYCFCQPCVYCQPVEETVEKLEVINRLLKIYPTTEPQKDALSDYAVKRVLQDVTDAIPLSPKKDYLRKFEFTRNWPAVAPARRAQQQQIQTQVVTQILYGQVQQNVMVQGGVVSLDVPLSPDLVTTPMP